MHPLSLYFKVVLLLCAVLHQVGQNFTQELAALAIVLEVLLYLLDPLYLSRLEAQCSRGLLSTPIVIRNCDKLELTRLRSQVIIEQ